MKFKYKFSLITLVLLVSFACFAATSLFAETRSLDSFLQKSFGDFKEDMQTAKNSKKKGVMLFFEQKDCPFCHRMKNTVLNQARVQDFYNKNFILFSVDIQQSEAISDFQGKATTQKKFFAKLAKFRGATPLIVFFDLKGKMVMRYTGATKNADEFIWLGEYVAAKQYTKIPFTKYKRNKRRAGK